jgi:hypothetical protein
MSPTRARTANSCVGGGATGGSLFGSPTPDEVFAYALP